MRPVEVIERLEARYENMSIDWESLLEHAYRSFLAPGAWTLDVGGHAGRHADVLAGDVGCARVDIVEPLPDHAAALEARFAAHPGVAVHPCALGAEPGRSRFVFNAGAPEESGLRERRYNVPEASHLIELEVEVRVLDALCAHHERLDFVKIDTEGGEMDILEGGEGTLDRHRPILSVEYGAAGYEAYGKTQDTLYRFAEAKGYRLLDLFGLPFETIEDWRAGSDRYYWDFLMVPLDRVDAVRSGLAGQLARVDPEIAAAL